MRSSGVMKDIVNIPHFSKAEIDFVANDPGPSLLHCHMQLHMDFGFMLLVKYV
jgi:FtsP/CotA-like multicopper oxidase with cupredoxin domain